jgi:flagellar biogenesis protein FliO
MILTSKTSQDTQRTQPRLFAAICSITARGVSRFRDLRKPRTSRRLQLVEALPLGGKRQLLLISCDGCHYLIGAGSDAVSAITPIARVTSAESTDSAGSLLSPPDWVRSKRSLFQ